MGSCNSAALYTNGGEIVIRIGAGGHAIEATAAIKVGGEGGIPLQGVERLHGNSLLFLGPTGLGGGDKLDGVLLDLHGEMMEGGHCSLPPFGQQLERDIPNYRESEGFEGDGNQTSVCLMLVLH